MLSQVAVGGRPKDSFEAVFMLEELCVFNTGTLGTIFVGVFGAEVCVRTVRVNTNGPKRPMEWRCASYTPHPRHPKTPFLTCLVRRCVSVHSVREHEQTQEADGMAIRVVPPPPPPGIQRHVS